MNKPTALAEGRYCMTFETCVFQVQVRETMTGQSPDRRESLLVHFESGFPRFPMPAADLRAWGAKFHSSNSEENREH